MTDLRIQPTTLTLPARLRAIAVTSSDRRYRSLSSTFFRGGAPAVILRAASVADVQAAVRLAAEHPELPFSVRSGGHGIAGRSTNDGGILLDLAALNSVTLLDSGVVRVGPGARWIDVARVLEPHGLGISSGDYGGVGVGGLATAGGSGWLVREGGLTIDHLLAVDVVLADGSHVRADADHHPDLFWATRGAGAGLGVVTSFDIAPAPVSTVGHSQMTVIGDPATLMTRWGAALERAPRAVTSSLIMGPTRPGQPGVAQIHTVVHSRDRAEVTELLTPFAATGQVARQGTQLIPYRAVIDNVYPGPHQGAGEPHSRAGVVRHLTRDAAEGFAAVMSSGHGHYFQIRSLGGAVSDIPTDATAFAHRDANFLPSALGSSRDGMNRAWDGVRPFMDGLYSAFDSDDRPERLHEAFPPATRTRLQTIKTRYDADNVFRDNRSLTTT